jgi:hypothetical protein
MPVGRQGGADHALPLLTAPGVAGVGGAAMAPQQEQQAVGPLEGRSDQSKMPFMKGLEPSDEDGDVRCSGGPA